MEPEGPQEMFHLEEAPQPWSAASRPASHPASHEAGTHKSSAPSEAPSQAAYDPWSTNPAGLSASERTAQHNGSSAGIDMLSEGFQHRTQVSDARRNSTDSNSSYGDMPTALAEQVCHNSPYLVEISLLNM